MQTIRPILILILGLGLAHCADASADEDEPDLAPLVQLLGQIDDAEVQLDLLKGMREGLRGRTSLPIPKSWPSTYQKLAKSPSKEVREQAKLLALIFGDPQVLRALQVALMDQSAKLAERQEALNALVEKRVQDLAPALHKLLNDNGLRRDAIRGLAAYDHRDTPKLILARYPKLSDDEKRDALSTLASRPDYAVAMLAAMEKNVVPRLDLSAFTARRIHNLGDKRLTDKLRQVWGEIRLPAKKSTELIAKYKTFLTDKFVKRADLTHGRLIFHKTCAQCHTLYDEGGKIGPDLTGSNRNNLDYVLENVLAPSALIGKDYQLTNVYTKRGRVIAGLIVEKTPARMVVQTATEKVIVPGKSVDKVEVTTQSMMPDGLFDKLTRKDVRDLIGYLRTSAQVPLPKDAVESTQPK